MSLSNALSNVQSRKFVVASVDAAGYFSMSSRPVFHGSNLEAISECKRLAAVNPGKAFVVMQLVNGAMVPSGVQTF